AGQAGPLPQRPQVSSETHRRYLRLVTTAHPDERVEQVAAALKLPAPAVPIHEAPTVVPEGGTFRPGNMPSDTDSVPAAPPSTSPQPLAKNSLPDSKRRRAVCASTPEASQPSRPASSGRCSKAL